MELDIVVVDSLPRFAWLVEIAGGRATAHVGPWVEHGDGWFVEGAWNGDYESMRPDLASCMVGSACVVRDDGIVFVGPTNVLEPLYSVAHDGQRLVSNSLIFLMERVGHVPDPHDDRYYWELMEPSRRGIRTKPYILPGGFAAHTYVNVVVGPTGDLVHEIKPVVEPPHDYAGLKALFDEAIGGVFANGADPRRQHPLRPVAAISSGYDSAAIAGLAGALGCTEAVTSVDPDLPEDSGTPVGEAMGMTVTEYPRWPPDDLDVVKVAEFMAVPAGVDLPRAVMEDQLQGSILLVGNQGDRIFGKGRGYLPGYANPLAFAGPVASSGEFRKRIGMVSFIVPAIAGLFPDEVFAITHSEEMRAWSVPGRYDRPLARRFAEEAGIPREAFAKVKAATSHLWPHKDGLPRLADDAFESWLGQQGAGPRPRRGDRLIAKLQRRWRRQIGDFLDNSSPRLRRLFAPLAVRPWWHRSHMAYGSTSIFGFHWGVSVIRDRYRLPATE